MSALKKEKLAHNFFSLGLVQAINSSLQLLVIPHVIAKIGADGFGVVAVAQVLMFFLSTLTDYGFTQTATRQLSINRQDLNKVSGIFSRVMYSKLLLSLVSFLILLLLVEIVPAFKEHRVIYLTAFVMVIGQSMLLNWFFQGLERMWFIAITTLVGRILFVVLVFLFITGKEDGYRFLLFVGIGNIVAGIAGYWLARKMVRLRLVKVTNSELKQELKEGWPFTVTNLSMNTCQYANVFILSFFTNNLIVGYFSIAERVYFTLKQVLVIFSQAVYPRICLLVHEGRSALQHFYKKIYLPFLLAVITGSFILFLLAEPVLKFFSKEEAVHSVFYLRMFCLVLVIVCLNIPSTLTLLAMNRKKRYFTVYTAGGIINIVSNILLASFLQSQGTIIAIFITEIFITAGVIYASRRFMLPIAAYTA